MQYDIHNYVFRSIKTLTNKRLCIYYLRMSNLYLHTAGPLTWKSPSCFYSSPEQTNCSFSEHISDFDLIPDPQKMPDWSDTDPEYRCIPIYIAYLWCELPCLWWWWWWWCLWCSFSLREEELEWAEPRPFRCSFVFCRTRRYDSVHSQHKSFPSTWRKIELISAFSVLSLISVLFIEL